jgi:membrane protease YdiL (CAAX protease family)
VICGIERGAVQDPEFPPLPDESPDPATPVEPELSARIAVPDENPVWNGWDVILIAAITLFTIFVFVFATTFAAQKLLYPRLPLMEVGKIPLVTVVAQLFAYVIVFAFMVWLVSWHYGRRFYAEVRWKWPEGWWLYLGLGVVLSISLQVVASFLPMPKELPIDRFFKTPAEAWVLSLFGMSVAPLMEELFFRGFLYPVLVRRLGLVAGIGLTSLGFGLIHAPQLGRAWAPVLVVFLVGVALTVVRARTKSVAASMLVHIAYNGTLSLALFVASGGFRNLEKLNQ